MRTITIFLTLLTPVVQAATYHVALTGNDANDGLTTATAFATIQHGADIALAGDSVLVHPGDHQGFAAMDNSGTEDAPIVFIGTGPGVDLTSPCGYNNLDGINVEGVAWIVIEGFTVNDMPRTGIRNVLSDHVTIRYNTCHGNFKWGILCGFAEHAIIEYNSCSASEDEHGIYFSNSADDPIIRFNHCFDNNANGIHMNGDASLGGDGIISAAQVYGNVIHGNGAAGGSGINCDGVVNSVIFNNLLYDNHASGISLYQIDGGAPSTGNKLYNNTIINAADARWCVNIADGCSGNQVLNNILIDLHPFRGSITVQASAFAGFISDHNLVTPRFSADGDETIVDLTAWQTMGYDAHSQVADAQDLLFTSPGSDFHALDAGAQMVDAGTDAVNTVVSTDLEGVMRPQGTAFDIGCYEYVSGLAVPAAPVAAPEMTATGNVLRVRGAAPGAWVEWLDGAGRSIARSAPFSDAVELPAPRSHWGMAVLRNVQGDVVAVLRVVIM